MSQLNMWMWYQSNIKTTNFKINTVTTTTTTVAAAAAAATTTTTTTATTTATTTTTTATTTTTSYMSPWGRLVWYTQLQWRRQR